MVIGICDDNEIFRAHIRKVASAVVSEAEEEHSFLEFSDGIEVVESNEKIDILILDIEMPGMNGIEVKEHLQNRKENTLIIYVTGYQQWIKEAFGEYVLGFVERFELETKLPVYLRRAICRKADYILLDKRIDSRKILYVKSSHVYVEIYQKGGKKDVIRKTLRCVEQELCAYGFVQISRAFIINMAYIKEWKMNKILLEGLEERLCVSVRRHVQVRKAYEEYCGKQEQL